MCILGMHQAAPETFKCSFFFFLNPSHSPHILRISFGAYIEEGIVRGLRESHEGKADAKSEEKKKALHIDQNTLFTHPMLCLYGSAMKK